MGARGQAVEQALASTLLAVGRDGRPRFTDDVLRDAIPLFLLALDADVKTLSPAAQRMIADFSRRAGLDAARSDADAERALGDYLAAHPIPADLRRDVDEILSGRDLAHGTAVPLDRLDAAPRPSATLARGTGAPQGVRAGHLARAALLSVPSSGSKRGDR